MTWSRYSKGQVELATQQREQFERRFAACALSDEMEAALALYESSGVADAQLLATARGQLEAQLAREAGCLAALRDGVVRCRRRHHHIIAAVR
jgi:hypothetical protein